MHAHGEAMNGSNPQTMHKARKKVHGAPGHPRKHGFVPPVMGLIIAGEIVRELTGQKS